MSPADAGYVAATDDGVADPPYGATVPNRDDSGQGAGGAGVSPADPGATTGDPGTADPAARVEHAGDDRSELVEAVEDLVRDLLPEPDGCRPG